MLALRMKTAANIEVARDGQEAIGYLVNDRKGRPRLVLLDLKRPRSTGSRCCGVSGKASAPDAGGHPDELKRARSCRRELSTRGLQLRPQAGRLRRVLRGGPSARLVLAHGQRAAAKCPRPVTMGSRDPGYRRSVHSGADVQPTAPAPVRAAIATRVDWMISATSSALPNLMPSWIQIPQRTLLQRVTRSPEQFRLVIMHHSATF